MIGYYKFDLAGCLSPIEPFAFTNRFETAALSGIVMIEVLMALERFLIDISELWSEGVLEQLLARALVPLVYSIRYYPILVSLRQRDPNVRFFAFIYIMGNITYIIIRRCSCMDFLPLSKKFSTFDEAKRRLELGNWIIIYGLFKNGPQFILLSYIGAEIAVRFFYDSIFCKIKTKRGTEAALTPGTEFNMHFSRSSSTDPPTNDNSPLISSSCMWKFINQIYPWDNNFRFTTMDSAYMAYVSYLHMEKTYRQPAQSESVSIPTENMTEEPIAIQRNPIAIIADENYADLSDSDTIAGEILGEEDSYDSPEGEEPGVSDNDDASSVASSIYQRRSIITTPGDLTLPISPNVQYRPNNSQQRLTNPSTTRAADEQRLACTSERDHRDSKRNLDHVSTLPEQQPLMSSAHMDSEEEDRPPKLPLKTYKTTDIESRDNHFNSSDV
ncbi:unnamed protein product [Rotaria sp. Silwood2]|nr:unnamed protein product [Rotaria sp. Silwood2]CAF3951070.1 unnamed protein product [Rotaria sp. Silwood2]CAF4212276.1 unnamed protein product [Rotaria sp. Silwood2]